MIAQTFRRSFGVQKRRGPRMDVIKAARIANIIFGVSMILVGFAMTLRHGLLVAYIDAMGVNHTAIEVGLVVCGAILAFITLLPVRPQWWWVILYLPYVLLLFSYLVLLAALPASPLWQFAAMVSLLYIVVAFTFNGIAHAQRSD